MRRVVEANVIGTLLTSREAARRLSTARGGPGGALVDRLLDGDPARRAGEYVDYAASKGALDS